MTLRPGRPLGRRVGTRCAAILGILAGALPLFCTAQEAAGGKPARGEPAEPAVQRTVIEDDLARIDELKVRGQTTRVVVRSKLLDARPYELILGDAGRDPSQRGRAAGQRVWNLLSF